ncbi:MAG: CDP-alcohol phosphatidyltransferase family protein [Clostridia bacterium]|nr:CDP-alcohol phosphatidyltransferase family protein [Clostridia bacterium]
MAMPDTEKYRKKIITLPNILSFFRICLIPVIVWLYCVKKDYLLTTLVLILSAITDIADGIIARHYGMISDFGKAFDPIADKLTQFAMLLCLTFRFRLMAIPAAVLFVKEISAGIMSLMAIHRSGEVEGADWHGKVSTALLYGTMILHLIWFNIPAAISTSLIIICTAMMLLSAVLYAIRNLSAISSGKEANI